jgi:hypothetical protein
MNSFSSNVSRRRALAALAVVPLAAQVEGQPAPQSRFRAGLVAYSYRTQLAAKTLSYEDLIRTVADWGLDGLDCTVYWFPSTSDAYLASLRKLAFKNGVQIYNAGVRVRLSQPTADLQRAEVENIKKWVDVADRIGASHVRVFGGPIPENATEKQAIAWAVEDGKKEPADGPRLLNMIGKAGYKGYIGLEYEGNDAQADVPHSAATLRTLVRKVSS